MKINLAHTHWAARRKVASQFTIFAAMSVALGILASSQPKNPREIHFENSRRFGLILVEVQANGKPAVLIVDTASDHTIISPEFADVQSSSMLDYAVSTSRGSGLTGTGAFAKATLRVGSIAWRDHRVVVMDMRELSKSLGQKVDGLLGIDFFTEFQFVVIDLRHHKLMIEP